MTAKRVTSSALPFAHALLRFLIVANWASAIFILALLFLLPNREWIMSAFKFQFGDDAEKVIWGMRAIAALGLIGVVVNYVVLKRLLAIVVTVREGDPFVAANAMRLQTIAWCLLVLQVLSIIIGLIAKNLSTPEHPFILNAGFSISGWLAVLLTFLLSRVFAEGTVLRDELEGTV